MNYENNEIMERLTAIEIRLADHELYHNNSNDDIVSLNSRINFLEGENTNSKLEFDHLRTLLSYSINEHNIVDVCKKMALHEYGLNLDHSPDSVLVCLSNFSMYAYTYNIFGNSRIFNALFCFMNDRNGDIDNFLTSYIKQLTTNYYRNSFFQNFTYSTEVGTFMENKYSYNDLCKILNENSELCQLIIAYFRDSYKKDFIQYLFNEYGFNDITNEIKISNFEPVCLEEIYRNILSIIRNKSNKYHDEVINDTHFIKKVRQRSPSIDNYFKLKDQY